MTGSRARVDEPYKALATAVIYQAVKEMRRKRPEIVKFFMSDWFETLADLARIDPDVVREKLGIPMKRRRKAEICLP